MTSCYSPESFSPSACPLPDAKALQVSPTTLNLQAAQGGHNPQSQVVNVLKNNNRTLSWSSSDNATWVSVSPTTRNITNSAQISVSVNPAGLAAGTYMATITVAVTKRGNVSIPVTLTVTSGSTPNLTTTSNSTGSSTSNSSNIASLTWNPDTSINLAGYKVYVGTSSGVYGSSINVGNVTPYAVTNLEVGNTYNFGVTAYNTSRVESSFWNEVSKSIY